MALITEATIRDTKPLNKIEQIKGNTAEGTSFSGEFMQNSAGTNIGIPLGSANDGIFLGYLSETQDYEKKNSLELNIDGGMIENLSVVNGSAVGQMGHPVYGTSNNDLVGRYANSAKFVGYTWQNGSTYRPVVLGREALVSNLLAGGPRGYFDGGFLGADALAADQRLCDVPVEAHGKKVTSFGVKIPTQIEGSSTAVGATLSLRNGTGTLSSTYTVALSTADTTEFMTDIAGGVDFNDGEEISIYVDSLGDDMTAGQIKPVFKYDNIAY